MYTVSKLVIISPHITAKLSEILPLNRVVCNSLYYRSTVEYLIIIIQ